MEQEEKDYVSRVHGALTEKVGGFDKTEDQFRELMRDSAYSERVYAALKEKVQGFDKTPEQFNELVSSSLRYKPDATRPLKREEIRVLFNTYVPGAEVSGVVDRVSRQLEGKTEADIVAQYPDLGKRLAGRKPSQLPGQNYGGSKSSGGQYTLSSLVTMAKKNDAFASYEQDQSTFAKADYERKNAQGSESEQKNNPFGDSGTGAAMYLDATKSAYTSAKSKADVARQKTNDELNPILEKDIDENYVRTNSDGFQVPDYSRIMEYSKGLAKSYGLPEDGYFKTYVYNQAASRAQYLAMKPLIDKYFLPEAEKIYNDPEFKQRYEEGFTTDDVERKNLRMASDRLKMEVESEMKDEMSYLDQGAQQTAAEIDQTWASYEATTMARFAELEAQAKAGQIPPNVAQSQFDAIKQEYEQAFNQANADKQLAYDNYLSEANKISSKYNVRLKRQYDELRTSAEQRVRAAEKKYAEGFSDPETKRKLEAAYNEAVNKASAEYEAEVKKRFKDSGMSGSDMLSGLPGLIAGNASTYGKSLYTALGGTMKSYGVMMGNNWLQSYGDQMSSNYTMPELKIEEASDLFNPQNFAQLTGSLTGSMLPSAVATATAAIVTRNADLTTKLAATMFTEFTLTAADMTGRMWDETFRQTGSVAESNNRAKKMWDAEMSMIPLYALSGVPYIETAISKIKGAKRLLAGAAAEYVPELFQELSENIAEENINQGKEAFSDYLRMADEKFKTTALTVAPVAILGGAGQVNYKMTPEEKMKAGAKSYLAKQELARITGLGKRDWIASMVINMGDNGHAFASTVVNTLFADGKIDEAQRAEFGVMIADAKANLDAAKQAGMNTGESLVYNSLAAHASAEKAKYEQAKQAGDASSEALFKQSMDKANQAVKDFAATKTADFVLARFSDGSTVVMPNPSTETTRQAIKELQKSDSVQFLVYGENSQALMDSIEMDLANEALPDSDFETNETQQQNESIQEQGATEVSVQPTPGSSEEVVEGAPGAESKEAAGEGQAETTEQQQAPAAEGQVEQTALITAPSKTAVEVFTDIDAMFNNRNLSSRAEAKKGAVQKYGRQTAQLALYITKNFESISKELEKAGVFSKIEC